MSWLSKVQGTVATSTVEAEMNAAQECVYLTGLLRELSVPFFEPVCLYVDNQASIELSKHSVHHGETKNFAIKLHYLRDLCTKQKLEVDIHSN